MDADPALGWIGIAALVGMWDLVNNRSLTSFARRHKVGTAIIGGITLAHLLGLLPDMLDPFWWVAEIV
jgi:hypothetical protein